MRLGLDQDNISSGSDHVGLSHLVQAEFWITVYLRRVLERGSLASGCESENENRRNSGMRTIHARVCIRCDCD